MGDKKNTREKRKQSERTCEGGTWGGRPFTPILRLPAPSWSISLHATVAAVRARMKGSTPGLLLLFRKDTPQAAWGLTSTANDAPWKEVDNAYVFIVQGVFSGLLRRGWTRSEWRFGVKWTRALQREQERRESSVSVP